MEHGIVFNGRYRADGEVQGIVLRVMRKRSLVSRQLRLSAREVRRKRDIAGTFILLALSNFLRAAKFLCQLSGCLQYDLRQNLQIGAL